MALIETNFRPTTRQLRQFSGICCVALPLLGYWWSGSPTVVGWLAVVGATIAVTGWLAPKWITPLFVGLMLITVPIGMAISEVAMLLIYVLVFLPIGILFRLMSRDRLQLHVDRQAPTYWQDKPKPRSVATYYRQS